MGIWLRRTIGIRHNNNNDHKHAVMECFLFVMIRTLPSVEFVWIAFNSLRVNLSREVLFDPFEARATHRKCLARNLVSGVGLKEGG